jgi:hypothetical protein
MLHFWKSLTIILGSNYIKERSKNLVGRTEEDQFLYKINNYEPFHEGIVGSGEIAPRILTSKLNKDECSPKKLPWYPLNERISGLQF